MAILEKVAASTNGERELSINRLIDIDGIAKKTAEAMYEIGIRGYADLAQYLSQRTAPQVSAALKEHGVTRPPAFIDRETWARQAREFAELESTAPASPEEETEPVTESEETPVKLCDARLEIGDVQLSVLGVTPDAPVGQLKAEVRFRLSGADAEELASMGIPFRIEGYMVEIESGVSELLASAQGQLVPQVLEYVGQQRFDIPQVGRYDFHSIVLLFPPGELAAFHRGPTLRVIP